MSTSWPDLIAYMDGQNAVTTEATAVAEDRYDELVRGVADAMLFSKANTSLMGDNIPGKPRTPVVAVCRRTDISGDLSEVEATDYGGFSFDGIDRRVPSTAQARRFGDA